MWDLPRPGLEPASPELAGRFSTTGYQGSPILKFLMGRSLQGKGHSLKQNSISKLKDYLLQEYVQNVKNWTFNQGLCLSLFELLFKKYHKLNDL